MRGSVTEAEARVVINRQLKSVGWQTDHSKPKQNVYMERAKTSEQTKNLEGKKPDYVCYPEEDTDKPGIVIEAKRPGKSLDQALQDAVNLYAKKIKAPVAIATDGWRIKTWHLKFQTPLFIDGREIGELFGPEMASVFIEANTFSSFSEEVPLDQKDLIKKFKRANNILKDGGFGQGMERFSEFANLIFLKLVLEKTGRVASHSWSDIQNKRGNSQIIAIKQMLRELHKEYGDLFEQTKIRSPKQMEKLIDILSSFRMRSIQNDIKGAAFEHFIHSYTRGLKNDLGQYFTPRHIVDMMVYFLKPQLGETIYDPFCGTGGMLIECFRYIDKHMIHTKRNKSILASKTLWGRDHHSVARIAMMNMIMFGDGHTNIEQGDSFSMLGKTKNKYDIVITNIPFSQSTEHVGEYPVTPSSDKANGNSIAVQHCLESLKNRPTSRAGIIVPISFTYSPKFKKEREYICDQWKLERVIELSPKCFQPYTEQQTAVLIIRNRKSDLDRKFSYFHVKNDGFSQDGYRVRLTGENDIDRSMDDQSKTIPLGSNSAFKYIDHSRIRKNQIRLGEVAKITVGAGNISPKTNPHRVIHGVRPLMMAADLARKHIDYSLSESYYQLNEKAVEELSPYLFPKNTILMPIQGKSSLKNHRALLDTESYAVGTLAGIEANGVGMHPYCIFYFLINFDVEDITLDLGYPGISVSLLESLPMPNYSELQQTKIIESVEKAIKLSRKLQKVHSNSIANPDWLNEAQ